MAAILTAGNFPPPPPNDPEAPTSGGPSGVSGGAAASSRGADGTISLAGAGAVTAAPLAGAAAVAAAGKRSEEKQVHKGLHARLLALPATKPQQPKVVRVKAPATSVANVLTSRSWLRARAGSAGGWHSGFSSLPGHSTEWHQCALHVGDRRLTQKLPWGAAATLCNLKGKSNWPFYPLRPCRVHLHPALCRLWHWKRCPATTCRCCTACPSPVPECDAWCCYDAARECT